MGVLYYRGLHNCQYYSLGFLIRIIVYNGLQNPILIIKAPILRHSKAFFACVSQVLVIVAGVL